MATKKRGLSTKQILQSVWSGPYCPKCKRRMPRGVPLADHDYSWHGRGGLVKKFHEDIAHASDDKTGKLAADFVKKFRKTKPLRRKRRAGTKAERKHRG